MHTTTRTPFTTIRIEGAILPPDLLQRIADGDASIDGLSPDAYHLAKGEKINEAINRAWNRVLGAWAAVRAAADKLPEGDPGTTLTRERWLLPLFQELGYGRLATAKAIEVEGDSYPISHGWQNTPVHLVGLRVDLDTRTKGVAGAARNSPHSLVQVLLNRSDAHLWGFVSNGLRLRILRDNASLTRQAYVEFDLQAMMDGQIYSDFVLLWLLCHQSRVEADRPEECWLEKWSRAAAEQGTRALDQLRGGVEEAISALGRGFPAHPANRNLRDKLYAGKLEAQDYYRQLLRLVYRLIFLFVAEDRGLLLVPQADAAACVRYGQFYSTAKFRTLAERRRGTRHSDLYQGLRLVMEKLGGEAGCPELGLPALGGFLFSPQAVSDLSACEIANHDLLDAVRALAFTIDRNARRVVDYKNLGSEELGSVYESLLELHPIINSNAGTFELKTASGNERKTTGSFYTPTSLINVLLDSALDPVLEEACRKPNPEQAILSLKVCDPASGSGHFLVVAAHRMARWLASIRTGDDEPSPDALRAALRDVISHCIYGVDVNPDAVELCKVSLWMEALEPGKPLSFLDNHIKCGNSLIGVMPGLDTAEISDEAFNPVTGDDKKIATGLKKRNKAERQSGQGSLSVTVLETPDDLARWVAHQAEKLNAMPEGDVGQVNAKRAEYQRLVESEQYARRKLEADLWTTSFFWRIQETPGALKVIAPTQNELTTLSAGGRLDPELVRGVRELSSRVRFFHWQLEFPEVLELGGFDCVLSNPPWERIKLQEEEFFAVRDPEIATAPNKAARQKLIVALPKKNPALAREFEDAKHDAEAMSKFVRESKRFPLTAVGDVNTYALFVEHARVLINDNGRVGIVVPSGIALDDTTKSFFQDLVAKCALNSLFEFENEGFFVGAGQGHMLRFALTTIVGTAQRENAIHFLFQGKRLEELNDGNRVIVLSTKDISLVNPNTQTCPIFRTRQDAEITKAIYSRVPVLMRDMEPDSQASNPWNIRFLRMFDSANDSHLFKTRIQLEQEGYSLNGNYFSQGGERLVPLYEAKMAYLYNHRHGDFNDAPEGQRIHVLPTVPETKLQNANYLTFPYYWINEIEVQKQLDERNWKHKWMIGWRDVTDARASARTLIASYIPFSGVSDKFLIMLPDESTRTATALFGNLCSLVCDYIARQKVGGLALKYFTMKQLPILSPTAYTPADLDFIAPRVLELVYTAWDLRPFAEDMGYHGEPFRWDEERRAHLRAELDAYYARLYGLTCDELRYILDPKDVYGDDFPGETFRVLKEKEIKQYGEYRTRRLVLEKWDAMEG